MEKAHPHFNPSSLLWAHEIRRENIHLLNEIDSTRAAFSQQKQTTKRLEQSTAQLAKQVKEVDNENRSLHKQIRDVQVKLDKANEFEDLVTMRIDGIKNDAQNAAAEKTGLLDRRIDLLEADMGKRKEKMDRLEMDMQMVAHRPPPPGHQAMMESVVRDMLQREMEKSMALNASFLGISDFIFPFVDLLFFTVDKHV